MKESPFEDLPVLGALSPAKAAAKLRELGEDAAVAAIEAGRGPYSSDKFGPSDWWPFGHRAWQHTAHAFGHLALGAGAGPQPIRGVGEIEADPTLKNGRVRIVLNALRIADYPGGGTHRVLFDFAARNQVPGQSEDLHFNATYRVREGEHAAIAGYPIFVGLGVGSGGVAFHCHTVNVKNEADESFLDFLEGDAFKAGLKLATSVQPAIVPLTGLALAVTKSIAQRNRNVSVQNFHLGLDLAGTASGARLAEGDYIAVQIPQSYRRIWRWDEWLFDPPSGLIVSKSDPNQLIPYNYVVFGISRYDGD